jgi:YegS/Rv2252/BmrU family lipid kinase
MPGAPQETVVVLNPTSGRGEHDDEIRDRAAREGYAVEVTEQAGDAIRFARDAAEGGASTVVAAGGDGTVNEVVRGVDDADALDAVTLGILPVGTGNNFAGNVGIGSVDDGFDVLATGRRRRIDLGRADDRPFVNSCVAGVTAAASEETDHDLKHRMGKLAYVVTTLRSLSEFDGLGLTVDVPEGARVDAWSGEALAVLVGNGRRFEPGIGGQAPMEDGLLDVAIVEEASTLELVGDAIEDELLGRDAPHVTHLQVPSLTITLHDEASTRFSLDGEMIRRGRLPLDVDEGALELAVGDAYDPHPER